LAKKENTATEETIFVYNACGQLIAGYSTQVEPQATAKVSYLTSDHLGTPRVITDQNGQVVSRRDFMPFGEEIGTLSLPAGTPQPRTAAHGYTFADTIRQKFTGYERDTETDLDFAQARMHNYNHGRFTSPDPLMASAKVINPQTFNRYSYVLNNPLNLIDPSGLLAGCPEGKKCEKDDDGNEYYIEDGKRIYISSISEAVTVTAEDEPVAVGFQAPIPAVVPEKVVEKVPWWKKWITRPVTKVVSVGGKALGVVGAIFLSPPSTGCGASPGMVPDGNGGCMKDPNRVDQDTGTGTKNKDDTDEDEDDKRSPVFVRFGSGPETLDGLRLKQKPQSHLVIHMVFRFFFLLHL
jgi:RHS repeat-associated protein